MSYRDDLDALSARHAALATEVAHKTHELDAATRMLDEAKARMRLPVLDNIRVASPCPAKWADMVGDEQVRHCQQCDKNVYNLSGMTREEAETLILAKQGKLCVRYFQRSDGTILTKDCMVGISKKRKRRLFAAGAAALLAAGGAAGLASRWSTPDEEARAKTNLFEGLEPDVREVAGGISESPYRHPTPDDLTETGGKLEILPDGEQR